MPGGTRPACNFSILVANFSTLVLHVAKSLKDFLSAAPSFRIFADNFAFSCFLSDFEMNSAAVIGASVNVCRIVSAPANCCCGGPVASNLAFMCDIICTKLVIREFKDARSNMGAKGVPGADPEEAP